MDLKRNIENEMCNDKIIIEYCNDKALATEFYSALCSTSWILIDNFPDDERIINRLMGVNPSEWSCTWRYAGGIIADIRNNHYGTGEDYLSFYCSGNEGEVSDLVLECFGRLGWEPRWLL